MKWHGDSTRNAGPILRFTLVKEDLWDYGDEDAARHVHQHEESAPQRAAMHLETHHPHL